MRFDSIGMFWEDLPDPKRGEIARVQPPIPDTGWKCPQDFPNLSVARVLAIDVETYDPELEENGPGWGRGKGHIVGVSVGADGGGRWYFPIRHTIEPEDNMDPEKVLRWLADTLANPNQPKVGANLQYDVGWLRHEGVEVAGELVDVQFAEALLAEAAPVALESLAQKYLGEGKQSSLLYEWCAQFYGGPTTGKQRKNIWRAPPRLVGPYAESDADLPLRLAPILYKELERENLLSVFYMECKLIRLMIEMRFPGVRIDLGRAERLRDRLIVDQAEVQKQLNKAAGFGVDAYSPDSLANLFSKFNIPHGTTPTGRPSFTKDFLAGVDHPVGSLVNQVRRLEKLRGTFIESYILNSHIDGRVYTQFHLLRGSGGGTRSGRFSSSTPNLQNVPSRDEELAPMIRGLFLPDIGHKQWRRYDYSQIEYRFLVHFAIGPGAEEARQLYRDDPSTDYHETTLDKVAPAAHWNISTPELRKAKRRPIKNINFGLIYGMGIPKLIRSLGLTSAEGKLLFEAYHRSVPFAKETMDACSREAEYFGTIDTILGRKSRFDLFESADWRDGRPALRYDKAMRAYGRVRRAYTHKALNRRLQGSAADLMKMAMLKIYEAGLFDEVGYPSLTVHDELDFSDPGGKDEAFAEIKHIMETAIPEVKVPVKADAEVGPDWGHLVAT